MVKRTDEELEFLDKAAIAAMAAFISTDNELSFKEVSGWAYEHADEMLEIRREYRS